MQVLDEMHHFTCRMYTQAGPKCNKHDRETCGIYLYQGSSIFHFNWHEIQKILHSRFFQVNGGGGEGMNIWMENQKCATCVNRKIWTNKKGEKGKTWKKNTARGKILGNVRQVYMYWWSRQGLFAEELLFCRHLVYLFSLSSSQVDLLPLLPRRHRAIIIQSP